MKKNSIIVLSILAVALLATVGGSLISQRPVHAQTPVDYAYGTFQPGTISNSHNISAVNSSQSITLTGRAYIFALDATCTASTAPIRITDSTGTIWDNGNSHIGSADNRVVWSTGFTNSGGTDLTVTVDSCGAGNQSVLDIQASTGF